MRGNTGRMVTLLRAESFFRSCIYIRTHKHSTDLSVPHMTFGYVTEGVQKTYCNMAASEKLIRDGSTSVLFMCDAREVT